MFKNKQIFQAIKEMGVELVAKKAGISRATLFRALSGKNVRVDTLQKLLTVTGHSLTVSPPQSETAESADSACDEKE